MADFLEGKRPQGKFTENPMPERIYLELAKEYGQNPGDVEQNWEPFWVSRAIILMQAEGELQRRRNKEMEKKARRG